MAQNGGNSSSRRIIPSSAAAGRLAIARSQSPSALSTQNSTPATTSTPAGDPITLNQPRPGSQRNQNEYIDTPLKTPLPVSSKGAKRDVTNVSVHGNRGTIPRRTSVRPLTSSGSRFGNNRTATLQLPITSQPSVTTFKKEKADVSSEPSEECHRESIICRDCRKCKCDACRNPRKLPSAWLCNKSCLCSGETIIDYTTCMCCVRGTFYHCTKDYDMDSSGASCADKPCSCDPHRRCLRWSCMGAISVILPCLLCYWPMKGCLKLCEMCYANYTNNGCQCRSRLLQSSESTPDKRLLDSTSDC